MFFDVLLDAIVCKILVETLPRFQRHALGGGWFNLLVLQNSQNALDEVLNGEDGHDRPEEKPIPTIKFEAIMPSTGRLLVIESLHTSVTSEKVGDHDSIACAMNYDHTIPRTPNVTTTVVDTSERLLLPPDGIVRTIIVAVFALSFYLPFAILVYYCNRHKPAIRYRNPVEMTFTATAAFAYCFARCMGSLFVDKFSCTLRLLSFGVPLQLGLVGYLLAELRVVLTFNLTEMMLAHAERRKVNHHKLGYLHSLLRRGLLSTYRICLHVAWNVPLVIILYSHDYSLYNGENCPNDLSHQVTTLFASEFLVVVVASLMLSFNMSKVVDNFGLRQSFQASGRILFIWFCIYFPLLTFFFDADIVFNYRADLFMDILISHTFIWIHIVLPLREAYVMSHHDFEGAAFKGTVGILDAYLHTPEGFQAFSTFAKSEFRLECVLAWKTLVDYRVDSPEHLSAFEIYEQHIAPTAPLSLEKDIPASILKRYGLAFEANSKYSIVPEEMVRDANYFDVLLDSVMDKILVETLPRFQQHALGATWGDFVSKYNTQMALDKMLDHEHAPFLQSNRSMPTIKGDLLRSSGRLGAIESRRESNMASSVTGDTICENDKSLEHTIKRGHSKDIQHF
ncbi:hypothetical protein H257_02614 [Aphanomyces astaci]|uniref:RGS domain-containing protein n=2 Tax=Aphanomyces astaci TaxID=112090 RepID=W4H4U6_APHAT|nr:hypothetical protein H257_02614 [Aphanomyces astaci]ETV86158.1 hypothetical protein H257_02614 [Aphanomyces astaci]|eukprot:XP_009824630.1 hypothetical protein H257_02614 [Aphanomyces astaci]